MSRAGPDCLVVGIGALDRGDDAVGPAIAAAVDAEVRRRGWRHVHVVAPAEPNAVLDLLAGAGGPAWRTVVLLDAVRLPSPATDPAPATGQAPPTGPAPAVDHAGAPGADVVVLETGAGRPPLPASVGTGAAGTHGFGVAAAVELARALERLPPRVVVVGVPADRFGAGDGLSAPVAAAVGRAAEHVLGLVGPSRP